MDLHVPSEHHQEGKQYSAEIELYHFYSIDYDNEMATVSVFMEAYEDAAPYKFLDKVICQWRRKEYNVRKQCGLEPVDSTYPGCFPLFDRRDLKEDKKNKNSNLREHPRQQEQEQRNIEDANLESSSSRSKTSNEYEYEEISIQVPSDPKPPFKTVADIIYFNAMTGRKSMLELEDINYDPAEERDWEAWIAQHSAQMKREESLYHKLRDNDYGGKHSDELHSHFRRLVQGDEIEWYNYWPLLGVRTE